LSWFKSYLDSRTQYVRCGRLTSTPATVIFGVPQESVLGPIRFLLYTTDLLRLIERHNLHPHAYADDTQICGFCPPSAISVLQEQMSACLAEVALWMRSNRLQLNTAKTEVLWCATSRRQHQIPQAPVQVGEDHITPAASVRDLGIYLSGLRHLHEVTRLEDCVELLCCSSTDPQDTLLCPQAGGALFVSLVLSRLDYGSATLVGLPAYQIDRLQCVLNAAARLVYSSRRYDHVTPLLRELH